MSRLTKWLDDKKAICIEKCEKECVDGNTFCPKCKPFTDVLVKLAEYEDAEEQGLLVKVECHCKDCVHWSDMVAGATEHVKLCSIGGYMVGKNGYCVYAEKKLEEMKWE